MKNYLVFKSLIIFKNCAKLCIAISRIMQHINTKFTWGFFNIFLSKCVAYKYASLGEGVYLVEL